MRERDEIEELEISHLFDVVLVESDGARQLPIKAPSGHEPCIYTDTDLVIGVTGAEAIFSQAQSEQIHRWPEFTSITGCKTGQEIDYQVLYPLITSPEGLFKSCPAKAGRIWVINKMDLSPDPTRLPGLAEKILSTTSELDAVWLTQCNDQTPIKRIFRNLKENNRTHD